MDQQPMTAPQAREKLKASGVADAKIDALVAKGINIAGLLAWVQKYGPMEVEAVQALIAVLTGA